MARNIDFNRPTFSERMGLASLPEPMRSEHLPDSFRNLIWLAVDRAITGSRDPLGSRYYSPNCAMQEVIHDYTIRVLGYPHDQINHEIPEHRELMKSIFTGGQWYQVLTFLEYLLRHDAVESGFQTGQLIPSLCNEILDAFESAPVAYTFQDVDNQATVVPRASLESGEATRQALETVENLGPRGARKHFRDATSCINNKDYAGGVRESIHAVESVARSVTSNEKATLGHALTLLRETGVLKHPALETAFKKLYGYTSDENGIRHALVDEQGPDVDLDDAIFMFAACAAFVAYLVNKSREMNRGDRS